MNLLRTVSSLSWSDKAKSDCYCLRHTPWHQMEEGGVSYLPCWVDATILLTQPNIIFSLSISQSSAPFSTVLSLRQFHLYTQISISTIDRKVTLEISFLPSFRVFLTLPLVSRKQWSPGLTPLDLPRNTWQTHNSIRSFALQHIYHVHNAYHDHACCSPGSKTKVLTVQNLRSGQHEELSHSRV